MITPFAPPNIGGAETHLEDLYTYLTKQEYQVTLLTYQPLTTKTRGLSYEEKPNLRIYRFYLFGNNLFHKLENLHPVFNFSYLTPVLCVRSFIYMLRHHQEVDVIHVFGLSAASIARLLKIFFKKPIIMSTETIYNFNTRSLFALVSRWVLRGFDAILAQSVDSKEDIARVGFPKDKTTVYNHWINLDKFKPQDKHLLKKQLGWEDKFTALYVGRLIPQKGIKIFIEAARVCPDDINFKIIGDNGPEFETVKQSCLVTPNLEFLGSISYVDLPKYYAAADVFVYTALYQEDMARVIIEALSCGTPVVVSNKGSSDYLISERIGFVVSPKAKEVNQKLTYLLNNPQLIEEMGRTSSTYALKFGDVLGNVITEAYNKVSHN